MAEKKIVAYWGMHPMPGYDCLATFYDDASADFFDDEARHRDYDRGDPLRRVLFGPDADEHDRHLAEEVCRYTYQFRVPHDLLPRIIAAWHQIQIGEHGEQISDISSETEAEIDAELNAIFWREINARLTKPLDQPGRNTDQHR